MLYMHMQQRCGSLGAQSVINPFLTSIRVSHSACLLRVRCVLCPRILYVHVLLHIELCQRYCNHCSLASLQPSTTLRETSTLTHVTAVWPPAVAYLSLPSDYVMLPSEARAAT